MLFTSLSITHPSLGPVPDKMQYTGPAILQYFNLFKAPEQFVSYYKTFLKSQQVGIALSFITLIKSSQKFFVLVSTLIANAPSRIPVRIKTEPTIISALNNFLPPLQNQTFATSFDNNYHISKSRLRPCKTFPSYVLIKIAVQALNVEYSYMKFKKNIFSNGQPLNFDKASISATNYFC